MTANRLATLSLIVFSIGIALLLIDLCPTAFGFGVPSNVADDPGIVGGRVLENQWWTWALSSHFVAFLPVGLIVALAGLLISLHRQESHAIDVQLVLYRLRHSRRSLLVRLGAVSLNELWVATQHTASVFSATPCSMNPSHHDARRKARYNGAGVSVEDSPQAIPRMKM